MRIEQNTNGVNHTLSDQRKNKQGARGENAILRSFLKWLCTTYVLFLFTTQKKNIPPDKFYEFTKCSDSDNVPSFAVGCVKTCVFQLVAFRKHTHVYVWPEIISINFVKPRQFIICSCRKKNNMIKFTVFCYGFCACAFFFFISFSLIAFKYRVEMFTNFQMSPIY